MSEIILWWIMDIFGKAVKLSGMILTAILLVIPFGIPILIAFTLLKTRRKSRKSD